ncbi:hypothetical protein SEUCBS139899_006546 [Sporothrix eucalyptigena]
MAPFDSRDSQTVTLPDGRTLGFAEYGAPDGHPVIYNHGFPSNRLEGSAVDKLAKRHKVRLLSLDRPGMGLSTLQPGRSMLDWPDDVLAFAKSQNITQFGILGGSGGGPYTLACARKLPPGVLTHVGVMCGAGDFDPAARAAGVIPTRSRWAGFLVKYWPWGFRMLLGGLIGVTRWFVRTRMVTGWIDTWLAGMDQKKIEKKAEKKRAAAEAAAAKADTHSEGSIGDFEEVNAVAGSVESLSTVATKPGSSKAIEEDVEEIESDDEDDEPKQSIPERREAMLRALFDTFAQGYRGTTEDARVLCSDFGIQYEEITFNPVMFWHGDKDTNTPLPWIKLIADRIPHAELKIYPGKTHYSLAYEFEEIIRHFSPIEADTKKTEEQ